MKRHLAEFFSRHGATWLLPYRPWVYAIDCFQKPLLHILASTIFPTSKLPPTSATPVFFFHGENGRVALYRLPWIEAGHKQKKLLCPSFDADCTGTTTWGPMVFCCCFLANLPLGVWTAHCLCRRKKSEILYLLLNGHRALQIRGNAIWPGEHRSVFQH